jgi:ubiquinone/menaquinone biosynthesis C-methylase UbiE
MTQGEELAETHFVALVEQWYVAQGVRRDDPLFGHWVEATGPGNYRAGQRIARELTTICSLSGKRVLDVGCGVGGALVSLTLAGAECTGIDVDADRLKLCRKRLELHGQDAVTLCGDAYHLPFDDASFDIVICTDVLEHVSNRARLISEYSRVLRSGGILYLAFPNLLSIRNAMRDPHYHLFGVTLLPLPFARWYTRLRRGKKYDVEILPVSPIVARLCKRHGIAAFDVSSSERVLTEKIINPSTIRHGLGRRLVRVANMLGLRRILRLLVKLNAATSANAVLMGFKS